VTTSINYARFYVTEMFLDRAAPCPGERTISFPDAFDLAYATALDTALWPDLLQTLSESVDCHAGGIVASTADRGLYEGVAFGTSREAHQNYLRRFHRHHPMRAGRRLEAGCVTEWRHILPRPVLERTEVYEVWNRPHDMGEGVLLTLWANDNGQQTISCVRNWRRGPFGPEELRW
jgi:hypothetical protein